MKKSMTLFVSTCFCFGMMIVSGCSHQLAIKNLDLYSAFGSTSLKKSLKIGIIADTTDPEQRNLLNGVSNAMDGYSAQVVFPYLPYQANSQKEVDVVAKIDIQPSHEGSAMNFLINWPGFLVFTPAWHGYIYKVNYDINCTLTKSCSKETIDQFHIPIVLDIRHAAINRTWTELGWLEVSIMPFVGGIFFMSYDESVTPLVSVEVGTPLGKYIAQEIVKRINASDGFSYIRQRDRIPG